MTPYRPQSFWTVARMLCGKDGKQQYDTKRRIYYSGDILPFSSLRRQILLWHAEWRSASPVIMTTSFATPAMRARPLEWFVPVPAYFLNKQTKNDLHKQAISLKGQIIKSNLGRWEPIRYYFVTRDNLILSAWRASSDLVTGAPGYNQWNSFPSHLIRE